jgi:hypothetical protein
VFFCGGGVLVSSGYAWVSDAFSVEGPEYGRDVEIQRNLLYFAFFSQCSTVFGVVPGAPDICDAASQIALIASRASKKEYDFLVGHDVPQISRARRRLILPWTKFIIPIIICYLRPALYLMAIGSGGMDPILIHIRMRW